MGNLVVFPKPLTTKRSAAPMAEPMTLVEFVPDKIVCSVLERLPARSVRLFRGVSRAWRRLLTDRDFLKEHHLHQPLEPMVAFTDVNFYGDLAYWRFGVKVLNFRTGKIRAVTSSDTVARDRINFMDRETFNVYGSCNGLLLLHFVGDFFVYNPATRQKASLPPLQSDEVAALYCYNHGGLLEEYRVLYHRGHGAEKSYYIISLRTLDPQERIRAIGCPSVQTSVSLAAALVEGPSPASTRPPLQLSNCLHWPPQKSQEQHILVFNTVSEVFSWMRAPVVTEEDTVVLLEMNGRLAMSTCRRGDLMVKLFILQNYHHETWVCAHRIQLPVELNNRFDYEDKAFAFIASEDEDVLVWTQQKVLHYNRDGRCVKDFAPPGFPSYVTTHLLRESLVPHVIV